MNHDKQVDTFCRIVALIIRRLLTANNTAVSDG